MALASHMGEYFGKTLVLEQWGYDNCQKSGISCWSALVVGVVWPRLNVGLMELSNTWKLLGLDGPCQPHG